MKNTIRYKGWAIKFDEQTKLYYLFTPEEMEQPYNFRTSEQQVSTLQQAKAFINNYN